MKKELIIAQVDSSTKQIMMDISDGIPEIAGYF